MKWKTQTIVNDLQAIINKKVIEEDDPQGERYTRELSIDNRGDGIVIQGFNLKDISDVDNPLENIEYVEIRNFNSDSDGGLSKSASKTTREIYFKVVDYFNRKKIQIVDNLRDYF